MHADYVDTSNQVTFTTRIYHPGINAEGQVCVSILRDDVSLVSRCSEAMLVSSSTDWSVEAERDAVDGCVDLVFSINSV